MLATHINAPIAFLRREALALTINSSIFRKHVCQMPGFAPGYANAQLPGGDKIANAPPSGLTTWANASRLPGTP